MRSRFTTLLLLWMLVTTCSLPSSLGVDSSIADRFELAMEGPFRTFDPFLFLVHHRDLYPAGEDDMGPSRASLRGRNIGSDFSYRDGWSMYHGEVVPGFPQHPHRGFETITATKQGVVDHFDSKGATGRYGNGDVQWMTAGAGVQHSEMFPLVHRDRPNTMELYQIWLNLPARSKMVEPHFAMFWAADVPVVEQRSAAGVVSTCRVMAGRLGDSKQNTPPPESWAADPESDVAVWDLVLPPGGSFTLPTTKATTNRVLYFVLGSGMTVDGQEIGRRMGVKVDASRPTVVAATTEEVTCLVLQGRPIGEKVVQHGPFVMNSQDEIMQAFRDYQRTQFGGWPWPSADHTHPREQKRFAQFPDGRISEAPES